MPYRRTQEEDDEALGRPDHLRGVRSFAMQHTLVSSYTSPTMVRTPDTVVRDRWPASGDDFAGEQLLLNYRTDSTRLGVQLGIGRRHEPDAVLSSCHADRADDLQDTIEPPRPKNIKVGLTAAVTNRRSTRQFTGGPPHGVVTSRNASSGGDLFPITIFVHAINVGALSRGTYEYLSHAHALKPVDRAGDNPPELFTSPDLDIGKPGFVLTFVYHSYNNSRTYGDSGVVFGLIEVGATLQNARLARTTLALVGSDQGGYHKQSIEHTLGLDGHSGQVVHGTVVGQGE